MANYSITVNSKFKPFSYQELLAPVLLATQAHQDVEEKYGELEAKANMYEKIANANPESKAASMYKKFSDDLRNAANELAINGLSPSSRKSMLDMKSRYSNEIQPIEYAVAAQSNLAKQVASQNPQLRMRYQEMPSIDELIANPNMDRRGYSGADIEKSAMTSAAAASAREWLSQFSRDPKNAGFMKQVQKMGYNVNTMKDIKDIPELNAIIQQVKDQFGYGNDDRLSQYNKDMLDAEILSGLFKGVTYKENASYQQDPVYMAHLNDSLARARMRYQKELDEATRNIKGGLALNPSNIYSSRELSKDEKKYKNALERYSQYFYKDASGRIKMTWKGWQEYNKKYYGEPASKVQVTPEGTTIRVASAEGKVSPSEFRKFMDSIGAKNINGWQPGNLGNLWNKYVTNSPAARTSKYDAMKTTEYIYDVPSSEEYQNNFKSKLSRAIGSDEKLVEVDYDTKLNKWVPTGKTLSFNEFDTKDYKLISRAPSEVGTTWFIKKDGEKAKRYLAPSGINITAEDGRDQAISEMLITQRMLQNPNLTSQQREKLEKHYRNLTQQQIMFESQLDLTNKTKTQNINPYYIP